MALTKEDLGSIDSIVERSSAKVNARIDTLEVNFNQRIDGVETKMERMEKRVIASIDMLQSHHEARLNEHERRIARLEQLAERKG